MEFAIEKRVHPNFESYEEKEIDIAYEFAKKAYKEFGSFLKAIVLFGGVARKKKNTNDVDILLIVDDLSIVISDDMIQAYRIIVQKIVMDTSTKLHITTLKFTSFWEYVRAGDPVAINLLRDGIALLDTGFYEPLQSLLMRGRIRPTYESIWSYYSRAPITLTNSRWHITQATLDLYWAVIDSAHAALMSEGYIPPTPEHAADLLEEKLCRKKLLEKKYVVTMRKFYDLGKKIMNNHVKYVDARDYEEYYKEAHEFVQRMKKFIKVR